MSNIEHLGTYNPSSGRFLTYWFSVDEEQYGVSIKDDNSATLIDCNGYPIEALNDCKQILDKLTAKVVSIRKSNSTPREASKETSKIALVGGNLNGKVIDSWLFLSECDDLEEWLEFFNELSKQTVWLADKDDDRELSGAIQLDIDMLDQPKIGQCVYKCHEFSENEKIAIFNRMKGKEGVL